MISSPLDAASWSESDTLALRAALSTIKTWDDDLAALLKIDSDSSSTDDGVQYKKVKTPYRRDVRKQKIAALRVEAQNLQCVVALATALIGDAASKMQTASRSEWERLASIQQRRRVAVELQNTKLRKMMRTQVYYAKRMLTLTNQMDKLQHALHVPPPPSFVTYRGPSIDPVAQLRSLEALIPRAPTTFSSDVFPKNGLRCFHNSQFKSSTLPEDGADLETKSVWMLPADVQRVANTMWVQSMRPANEHKNSMDIYEDTNALVSQFMTTSDVDDVFGAIQGQVATRMLPPDLNDGSVLIVMKMDALSIVGSEVRACASFDCWTRIESVQSPDHMQTGPISLVKRYHRMLMKPPNVESRTKSQCRNWTDAVRASPVRSQLEKGFEMAMHAVESLLLTSQ